MRLKKGFELRDVCNEKVIVGEGLEAVNFGKLISLNDTAVWVWQKARELGDFTAEQLATELCGEYDVDYARALSDMQNLLLSWQETGIAEA